jgi:hypothetical protein
MTAAITIDVDGADCYRAIHGLPPRPDDVDPLFARALPRFLEMVEGLGARATLFVIGADLARPELREVVQAAHLGGHEIASHSFDHDYGLSRRSPADIQADLARAAGAIEGVTGCRPQGFRAPGYNLSEALIAAVEATGHAYDSSLFPTPAYFAARAGAIARYRLAGRPSESLVGEVREFAGPRRPFRPALGARWRPAQAGEQARTIVEIPMSVAGPARLPWLGTTLALFPDRMGRQLTRWALGGPSPIVLELHAMDFLGRSDGVERALAEAQPDLQVPLATKLRRLEGALRAVVDCTDVQQLQHIAAAVS